MNTIEMPENEAVRMGCVDGQTIQMKITTEFGESIIDVVVKVISDAQFEKIINSQRKGERGE